MRAIKNTAKYLLGVLIRLFFYLRRSRLFWLYWLNREARIVFLRQKPQLDYVQRRILADLKRDGSALSSLDELFPGENFLEVFKKYMNEIYPFAKPNHPTKKFLLTMWNMEPLLDLNNPFVKFSLDEKILDIVNSHVGMQYKFYIMSLNETLVATGSESLASQRWHRDPEDVRVVKIFIYLNDVDENAGPFMYIMKSHFLGKWSKIFPARPPFSAYPPDGAIDKIIPKEYIKECTGKAGTVIFCETTGLHKGGFCKEKPRIMFTAGYYSSAAVTQLLLSLPKNFSDNFAELSQVAKYALLPNHGPLATYLYKQRRKFMKKGEF